MRIKSFALGGAALIGLIAVTAPAIAYTRHPATPAERKQTDDLNAQALQSAQTASQQAATQAPSNQTAMSTTDAPPSAAPTANVSQEPSAPAQTSGQPQASNAQGETKTAMASPGMAEAGAARVSLDSVTNSSQTLANASVETNDGQAVGAVQKVVTDGSGKPQTVDVALLGNQSKTVAIDATQLSYDQQRNVVVAQLSADQIHAMPPAPQG